MKITMQIEVDLPSHSTLTTKEQVLEQLANDPVDFLDRFSDDLKVSDTVTIDGKQYDLYDYRFAEDYNEDDDEDEEDEEDN